jgi:hypothetical protein
LADVSEIALEVGTIGDAGMFAGESVTGVPCSGDSISMNLLQTISEASKTLCVNRASNSGPSP